MSDDNVKVPGGTMSPSSCRKLVAVAAAARVAAGDLFSVSPWLRPHRGVPYPRYSFYEETGEHASEARTK